MPVQRQHRRCRQQATAEPRIAPVLDVRNLRMTYGTKNVLTGVTFTAQRGEVLAMLGPNGAGKTTTIEILEGFRRRSGGEVSVLGTDPARGDEAWRARLGVVLQSWRDHKAWRVRELLAYQARFYAPFATTKAARPWDVDELIEVVGLADRAHAKIMTLSGGQRRRLDVAIGIVGRPELVFLDEPTAGFDPHARRDFHDLVHRLADFENTTLLITTHDLDEAEKIADRVLVLDEGRIVADGSADQLARKLATAAEVRWSSGGRRYVHVGKIVMFALTTLIGLLPLVIPGIMVADNLVFNAHTWSLLTLTFVAGMLATVPIGLAVGALMKSSLQAGLLLLVTLPVIFLSGIFYPLGILPTWLQWVGQAFPFYWVGLGARAAMLPSEMVAIEIGESWRTLEMFTVLGVWAVIGMVLAPFALRHMAQRQSGATVAAARDRIMSKGY